jgi:hypothetical protein
MNSNPADSAAVSGGSGSPAATHHLFDRYVMVDWSAASSPRLGRDSIWIAQRTPDNRATAPVNISTRAAAMAALTDLVMTTGDERVLIGFDFTFGYPTGTADLIAGGELGATRTIAMTVSTSPLNSMPTSRAARVSHRSGGIRAVNAPMR